MTVAANRMAGRAVEAEQAAKQAAQQDVSVTKPVAPREPCVVQPLREGELPRILYVCSQRPGHGGASTETYEAIRRLRELGHEVRGVFIVGPEDRDRCDPDGLGGVGALPWERERQPAGWATGSWDVVIGKNTWAPQLLADPISGRPVGAPVVYVTSGVDAFAARGPGTVILPGSPDWLAFTAATRVVVHSTLDMAAYRAALPEALTRKIVPEVIRTSALAADPAGGPAPPFAGRRWDLCFSASDWRRTCKGVGVATGICRLLGDRLRIVVCGENFEAGCGGLARLQPAPPRADRLGLVSHRDMLAILRQSKVVAIPSHYDSSPNLYVEAVAAGCNVVVSPCVGNIERHPPGFLAPAPTAEAFAGPILAAVAAPAQAAYRVETAEGAAGRLSAWLGVIAREAKR